MENSTKVISALAIGLVAGAALGVLFAPASGRDTRRKIGHKVSELKEDLVDNFEKGKEKFNSFKDDVARKASDLKERAFGKMEDLRETAERKVDEMKDSAEKMRNKTSSHSN